MEIWKNIEGTNGAYQVSNYGRVKSVHRVTANGRSVNERILRTSVNKRGYEYVCIQTTEKRKAIKVHREVAKAFIKNPCCCKEVNHKDENKLNNFADNLEWCDRKYNANYGTAIERSSKARTKNHVLEINQFDTNGEFIKKWKSPIYIERESAKKMRATNIIACCRGKYHTSYGYVWKYA
jgi:hypothetical protein